MNERTTPLIMRLRRSIVEHPLATIKYRIFGHPRLLLPGHAGARTELGFAVMSYNMKRKANVLGSNDRGAPDGMSEGDPDVKP